MIINYNEFNNINDLMNALLDKVSHDGFDKLNENEKELLNKISNGDEIDLNKLKKDNQPTKNTGILSQSDSGFKLVGGSGKIPEFKSTTKFNIGDEVYPLSKTGNSLPLHATQYLNTKEKFTVLKLNSSGKIDIGCHKHTDQGKKRVFYYSTNRFTSIDPSTEIDDFNDNDWNDNDDTHWDNDNKEDNAPIDYHFAVSNYEEGGICVYLTAVSYYRREECLDDRLGGHNISDNIKNSFRRIGIQTGEDQDSTWSPKRNNNKTIDEIIQGFIDEGFSNNREFRNWLENDDLDIPPDEPNLDGIKDSLTLYIINTPYEEWGLEPDETTPISCAILHNGELMDMEISRFPRVELELQNNHLLEEGEGHLSYGGNLTKEQLIDTLRNLGYNVTDNF